MEEISPFFSIIVPTKSRPEVLRRAFESISEQVFTNYEVIIVNDGSDSEYQVAIDAAVLHFGSAFRLINRPISEPKHGPNIARNVGIESASGGYIGFLDDDDYYWCDKSYLQISNNAINETENADFFLIKLPKEKIRLLLKLGCPT